MNFTLRQITYFLAVARFGSFRLAAESVHVSQPGLSSQIAQLEDRLGAKLFLRAPGSASVTLTRLGADLLPEAERLIEAAQAFELRARAPRRAMSGRMRLGLIPTVAPYLIPALIPALRAAYPESAPELHEATTDDLLERLALDRLDAAIVALPIDATGFESAPILRDEFLIALAENDQTYLAGPAQPEKLAVERLLLLSEGHCLRDQALDLCGRSAARRQVNLEATSMATLMRLVAAGMGMTLIPRLALADENRDGRLRIVPFADPAPSRDLAVVWRRSGSAKGDALALAELIRDLAPTLGVAPLPV